MPSHFGTVKPPRTPPQREVPKGIDGEGAAFWAFYAGAMPSRLLVVADSFAVRRDTVVLPRFDFIVGSKTTIEVRLVRPDGTELTMTATIDVSHVRGDRPPFAMYRFPGVEPSAIPIGTEVWSVEVPA